MNSTHTQQRDFSAIAWGALLVWWGITEIAHFLPDGTGAIGVGLILLGVNAARVMSATPVSGFSVTIGILAFIWGLLELAGVFLSLPFELPIFAILLIVLGVILLEPEIFRFNKQN